MALNSSSKANKTATMKSNPNYDLENNDIFLKCLSTYYKNEVTGSANYNKLILRDDIVKAYNLIYKTNLKGYQLITLLRDRHNFQPFEPYQWQKQFLDEFNVLQETQMDKYLSKKNESIKENQAMDVQQEGQSNGSSVSKAPLYQVECKPDIPTVAIDLDYKTMSVYELKRALLISKLEMLDAQEALARARENIRLNEQEHLKRQIEKE